MTLVRFVRKNTFRNLRRSILTVLSIGFSLLLLTLMMAIWRNFYMSKGTEESALRLVTRHKVSLTFTMPSFYREKIRAIPGVAVVLPQNWFGGVYKDDKSKNFFRAVRHRSRPILQCLQRLEDSGRSDHGVAARSRGRGRGQQEGRGVSAGRSARRSSSLGLSSL